MTALVTHFPVVEPSSGHTSLRANLAKAKDAKPPGYRSSWTQASGVADKGPLFVANQVLLVSDSSLTLA
jgi:hypothetical protein